MPHCTMPHLTKLEAEAIYILREVFAEFANPVLLYSVGKESSVLLHLAVKAFHPSPVPFPILHIDAKWKFQEMIDYRDETVQGLGLNLIVHVDEQGGEREVSPLDQVQQYADFMKSQMLQQALAKHGFDAVIGGARRDERDSRATRRVFSIQTSGHRSYREIKLD
jgi:sulfate adenylyltransferase subunit 2